jgi:PHD/YefM family antitoxin component YafN of YafNO toxin-antitoxin module
MEVSFQNEAAVTSTMISIEELEEDLERARSAAADGPVFITENGVPAFVLLTDEAYRKIDGNGESIADLLANPEAAEIDFDPPRMCDPTIRPADLS